MWVLLAVIDRFVLVFSLYGHICTFMTISSVISIIQGLDTVNKRFHRFVYCVLVPPITLLLTGIDLTFVFCRSTAHDTLLHPGHIQMDYSSYAVKIEDMPEPLTAHSVGREETRDFKPLKTLPAPLELMVIATRYVNAAHRLSSIIAAGYTYPGDDVSVKAPTDAAEGAAATAAQPTGSMYADFVSVYRRYMLGAIISCEEAVRLGGPDIRQNLRARLMLAELLVRETHNTERTEQVIAKAVSLQRCRIIDLIRKLIRMFINLS